MESPAGSLDVLVIGAGAAGMMCAIEAGRRGRRTILLEHSPAVGRKILISGGGRCNFTNLGAGPKQYVSRNPDFCRSALARYTPQDFLRLIEKHRIPCHEKKLGQLFCDRSARDIVEMLLAECREAGVELKTGCRVESVEQSERFLIRTAEETLPAERLVIATGGLSVPKTGASDFGYRIAEQFGLRIVAQAPALDGFVFQEGERNRFRELAGVSADAIVTCGGASFRENILFTHRGLSGPASLQGSLYWKPGASVIVNFLPGLGADELRAWLRTQKRERPVAAIKNLLAERIPRRLSEALCDLAQAGTQPIGQTPEGTLERLVRTLQAWSFVPERTVGYQRAEVTVGGVDTDELSSKTMEAKRVPGLYFIGEVVDVTGWLGGYNFQWAWASGWAAGQAV